MDLASIIVNYQTASLAIECLHSLAGERIGPVIVVDNASADGSVEKITNAIADNKWSDLCHVVPLPQNRGYAAGNNAGIRFITERFGVPRYYLFLNPDTVVRPGAIHQLVEFMDEHPRVGIAGSRLEDSDGTPQRSAFRFPSIFGELENALRLGAVTQLLNRQMVAPPVRNESHRTDWVAGASMIVRREVLEQIGGMDEKYFLYFEEVDYCLRAHRAGWSCWYVPQSRVVHLVGQSTGVTDSRRQPRRLPAYWFESRQRYFRKNHGLVYSLIADLAWASGYSIWRIRRKLQRKIDVDPPGMLADFLRYNFGGRRAVA